MKQTTLIAIAVALAAVAYELNPEGAPAGEEGATDTPKPRGRPKGSGSAPAEPEPPKGKTYEELREIIKPAVDDAKGEEVKKLIARSGAKDLKELATMPDKQAAFIKDVEALTF